MTPEEIDRWDPAQIGEVFRVCKARKEVCATTGDHLKSPELFETWGGSAAKAADEAAGKKRADLDAHGTEVAAVAQAASVAQAEVEAVKRQLAAARDFAAASGLVIDDASGDVDLPAWEIGTMNVDRVADRDTAQAMVNKVMADADAADRALAHTIQAAIGAVPASAVNTQTLPKPEEPDHLPGHEPRHIPGVPGMNPSPKMSSTRVLPVRVPKGWKDPSMNSDLAKRYALPVTITPTSQGARGGVSKNLLPQNPETGDGMGGGAAVPFGKGKNFELGITQQKELRVVGAQPAQVGSVDIGGVSYLAVTYEYDYEVSGVTRVDANGVQLTTDNAPHWEPISRNDVTKLHSQGVRVPDPGRTGS
ncbi:hypothetical protein ACPXCG_14920 [Gordonia sp. DT218]|uniref:hypothetical protein n=1 Tax=Gordonia sp. DT218 TaxID=3416659 RepID=UPI003CF88F2E